MPRAPLAAPGVYVLHNGLEDANEPVERSRADAGALGQGAAQPVHSALFNYVLQVPGAGYEHAEQLDGRPGDADNGPDAPDDV